MVGTNNKPYYIFCELCGQEYNIIADEQDVIDWLSGDKYIQDALGYLYEIAFNHTHILEIRKLLRESV